ncbi:MAG: sensor histidine kinase [Pseudodesulfovibrio sp.]|uniref:sensor histidine kinase n=1 Tax=Pseudodesulfovibrio sp. TaxID=2035812 RepID=UPI003D10BF55
MKHVISATEFAPSERYPAEHIGRDYDTISNSPCSHYFDYFPLPLLVVNDKRQAVFSNQAFVRMLGITDVHDFLGRRPGEIMRCAYSDVSPGGCGTSGYCRECGAVHAVLESINNDAASTHDCQILQSMDGESRALDLRVHASPFVFRDTKYYVVTIMDIADEKEREVMERIFFHDILNSAGSAKSLVELLLDEGDSNLEEPLTLLAMALFGLVEEIQTQKDLRLAEKGNYPFSLITMQSLEMVNVVANEYRAHPLAEGKRIEIMSSSLNSPVKADYSLLRRVLINMLKNALEATESGGVVRIGSRPDGVGVVFEVQNDRIMDRSVQLQVFKRSFSTKGKGRGLGTYSIKLLTENWLNGRASFESVEGVGTIFRVVLPS